MASFIIMTKVDYNKLMTVMFATTNLMATIMKLATVITGGDADD